MRASVEQMSDLKPSAGAYLKRVGELLAGLTAARGRGPVDERGRAVNTASLAIDMIVQVTAEDHGGVAAVHALGFAFGSTIAQLPFELRSKFVAHFMDAVREASDVASQDTAAIDAAKAGSAGNA